MTNDSTKRAKVTRWTNAAPPPSLPGARRGLIEDPEIARLLGQIVVDWPHFEDQMVGIFNRLLGLPTGDYDTARLIFHALVNQKIRIDVMRNLLERSLHNRAKSDEYDAIIKEFKKLNDLRNRYVHGLWWTHENGDTHLQSDNSVFSSHAQYRKVTSKELQAFIDRLNTLWHLTFTL